MLFNLRWESNKQKIAIAIIDNEKKDDWILIKADLANAFSKKIVKKILQKITDSFESLTNYQITIDNKSFTQENIGDEIINNVQTLASMLKELVDDIIDELKIKDKPIYL